MQITRHWRMNNQRYRLEGVKHSDGQVSLSPKHPTPEHTIPAELAFSISCELAQEPEPIRHPERK